MQFPFPRLFLTPKPAFPALWENPGDPEETGLSTPPTHTRGKRSNKQTQLAITWQLSTQTTPSGTWSHVEGMLTAEESVI